MPKFGAEVTRSYLLDLLQSGTGVVVLAERGGAVAGFLVLRFGPVDMTRFLTLRAVLRFLGNACRHPVLVPRLAGQLWYRAEVPENSAEIDFFAVDATHRSAGIGSGLLDHAEAAARARDCTGIFTKTNNADLAGYYRRDRNARLVRSFRILSARYFNLHWPV